MHKNLLRIFISKIDKSTLLNDGWMLLFAAGWGELKDEGKFFVDKKAFDLMMADIADQGNEIPFDYEHQTLKGTEAPASGWNKEYVWEDGVGVKVRVDWTEKAASYLEKDEYRFFSPVFYIRKSDKRICGLHSVALTNTPKTKHLTPILAKLEAGLEAENNKERKMDREQLIAALGLKADATDADIMAAIAKAGIRVPEAQEKEVIPESVIAALELDDKADTSTVVASIHALNQAKSGSVSRTEFDALQAKLLTKEADDLVDAAIAKGKITPDQKEWAIEYAKDDPKGFETFVAKAPVVVPVEKLGEKKKEPAGDHLSPETKAIAKMVGNTEEDIKTHATVIG